MADWSACYGESLFSEGIGKKSQRGSAALTFPTFAAAGSEGASQGTLAYPTDGLVEGDGEKIGIQDSGHHYLMIKNIPCRCRQSEILEAVAQLGFGDSYEFFYLPLKRVNHRQNFGYAFIGFESQQTAEDFTQAMAGYHFGSRNSHKVIEVVPARIQGKDEAVAHFSKTKVLRSRWSPIFSEMSEMGQSEAGEALEMAPRAEDVPLPTQSKWLGD